jgi:hypothetical protein
MFCMAYVRRPPVFRESKLDRRADPCIHLGTNPRGPGYRFEVLSGPRKGKLITSSQAVFRENVFPLRQGADGTGATTPPYNVDAAPATEDEINILYPEDTDVARVGGSDAHAEHDSNSDNTYNDTMLDDTMLDSGDADDDNTDDYHDQGTDDQGDTQQVSPEDDAAAPRRSARIAGVQLPQTTMQYRAFKGALATRVVCEDTQVDAALAPSINDTQAVYAHTFATGIDVSDDTAARPLSIHVDAVPQPMTTKTSAPEQLRSFADILSIPDVEQRARRLQAYYKEYDGLFSAPSGLRAVPQPTGNYRTVRLKEIHSDKKDGRAKMRVVARGDMMHEGIDYDRTFSPTVKYTSLRAACAIAAERDMDISGGDITQAYVRADWPSGVPLYAHKFADGYNDHGPNGEKLAIAIGNLYGKPDSGRNLNSKLDATFKDEIKMGGMTLTRSEYDHSVYFRWEGNNLMLVLLYVDDLLIFADKGCDMRVRFMDTFKTLFPVEDFGEEIGTLHEFLSIRIVKTPHSVCLDSERYITELAAEMFPGGVHAQYAVPATVELPKLVEDATRNKDQPSRLDKHLVTRYRRLVGAMLYVSTTTRPDITYAVGMTSRCLAYPTPELLAAAERVLIYLVCTRSLRLTYTGGDMGRQVTARWAPTIGTTLEGKSDANWQVARSTSGFVFEKTHAAISWGMKKQQSIALSTFEAETMAASLACCEAVWLRNLFEELGFPPAGPTVLYLDNSAAIDLAHDPVHHASAKHIKRRELFIRELVADNVIKPIYVKTADNTADIFTKPLDRKVFQKHRDKLLGITE